MSRYGTTNAQRLRVRRAPSLVVLAAVVAAAGWSCSDDDPAYGPPNAIKGQALPGTDTSSSGGGATGTAPTVTAAQQHAQKGGPTLSPTLDCLSCHDGGRAKAAAYAGYVAVGSDGGASAALVSFGALDVTADADGYFWHAAAGGAPTDLGAAKVTGGAATATMAEQARGSCNDPTANCHGAGLGKQGSIHLP